MKNILTFNLLFIGLLILASCSNKEGNRQGRGIDFAPLKETLSMTDEQDNQFDATIAKYQKIAQESRAAASAGGAKPDRVEMFKQMEERGKRQAAEMATFLSNEQMQHYETFIAKHTRKRPRYSDELLANIKATLALDDEQATYLEAANDAFERSYQDAHDFYHGNGELAREYWQKYDAERKTFLKKVFSEEQYTRFIEIVDAELPMDTERGEKPKAQANNTK